MKTILTLVFALLFGNLLVAQAPKTTKLPRSTFKKGTPRTQATPAPTPSAPPAPSTTPAPTTPQNILTDAPPRSRRDGKPRVDSASPQAQEFRRRHPDPRRCNAPLFGKDFRNELFRIKRMTNGQDNAIRDLTVNNCLLTGQIRELALLYPDPNGQLLYVQSAFSNCFDWAQYEILSDLFVLRQHQDQFNEFLDDNVYTYSGGSGGFYGDGPRGGGGYNNNYDNYNPPPPPLPPPPPVYVPGYNGPIGCPMPVDNRTFQDILGTIAQTTFENTRLQVAKQITSTNCLTVSQIMEVCKQFTFENNRLDYAKFAYDYVYDVNNYFRVGTLFTFNSNVADLTNYIGNRPRGNSNNYNSNDYNAPPAYGNPAPPPSYVPGYNGTIGCPAPMDNGGFDNAMRTIKSSSFDNTRLQVAKQISDSNCFTAAQVREVCKIFSFENNRLDFAKYAYAHTYDINNYHLVNNVFDFDASRRNLTDFIRNNRR